MNENSQLGVRVVYRNKNLDPIYTKTYSFMEYTEMLRTDLLRLVTDIEDLCYAVNGNKSKEEWSDETFAAFNKIKHKILDKAGDIGRLPANITEITAEPLTNFVARLLNEGADMHGESRMGQVK